MGIQSVAIVLAIAFVATNAVPYSKFGRSCKDIGCLSNEVCVMAEEPCNYGQRDQCGRFPTCQRSNSGGESCTTKICPSGQYCRTENGRPTCVNTNAGLEEERNKRPEDTQEPKPSAPLPDNSGVPDPGQIKVTPRPASSYPGYPSSGNSGYPGYPSSGNSGYPGYPSSGNSGYPSYPDPSKSKPSTDRFGYPVQSQSVASHPPSNNYGYPGYPNQDPTRRTSATMNNAGYPSQSGYPGYPGQGGYPAQNPYNNPYGGYRPQQQQGPYQGGYYPQQQNGGYPNQGGYNPYGPPTTKKPSFTDKIANYAKNVAKQVITQAIIDKVSG